MPVRLPPKNWDLGHFPIFVETAADNEITILLFGGRFP